MSGRRGFTLIELLTSIAVLVIVFGLMISLSNFVRNTSATDLTISLLRKIDDQLSQYSRRFDGQMPAVPRFDPASDTPEVALAKVARQNNEAMMRALGSQANLSATVFADLPSSVYDPESQTLRDAWGSPIVFMPAMHPAIGMALDNRPFFFSAGPDRKYLTREDNLYSYEAAALK
jgi:prepilin-type N-terminal cleavage/methylation domain-containing protein